MYGKYKGIQTYKNGQTVAVRPNDQDHWTFLSHNVESPAQASKLIEDYVAEFCKDDGIRPTSW